MMDDTTWMNAKKAIELGFADEILTDEKRTTETEAYAFSGKTVEKALINKLSAKTPVPEKTGRKVDDLYDRLNLMKF